MSQADLRERSMPEESASPWFARCIPSAAVCWGMACRELFREMSRVNLLLPGIASLALGSEPGFQLGIASAARRPTARLTARHDSDPKCRRP